MTIRTPILAVILVALCGTFAVTITARAENIYINEIYFDPPGGLDITSEYIELRGTAGMSLADHYLIFLENEGAPSATPGVVDRIFDLTNYTMGSNGFLTLRQKNNPYVSGVAPGTTDLVNSGSGNGWGTGASSSIGVTGENNGLIIENSGFTAMLINTHGMNIPVIGMNLDLDGNGLDHPDGQEGWSILDSIGVHSEFGEAASGRLYGKINFGPDESANVEPGSTYVALGFEVEYVGRWGNSTGWDPEDWHVSNLTDNPLSGYQGEGDFRQSAEPHGSANVESSQNVPYGTNLTDTLGAPNLGFQPEPEFLLGDFSLNQVVNGGDIQAMLDALVDLAGYKSTNGLSDADLLAIGDMDNSGAVNGGDIQGLLDFLTGGQMQAAFQENPELQARMLAVQDAWLSSQDVPEPSSMALLALGGLGILFSRFHVHRTRREVREL